MNISLLFLMVGAITDRSLSQQERAFAAKLYTEYYPLIRSKAGKMTQNSSDRDDLVHNCYLRLLTHIDRLVGLEKPQLIRYIERVVLTCYSDFKAKNPASASYEEIAPVLSDEKTEDVQEYLEQQEMYRIFHEQFEKLTDHEQQLLYLRYVEELSLKEIGERLKITPGSVNTALCRARKKAHLLITNAQNETDKQ